MAERRAWLRDELMQGIVTMRSVSLSLPSGPLPVGPSECETVTEFNPDAQLMRVPPSLVSRHA